MKHVARVHPLATDIWKWHRQGDARPPEKGAAVALESCAGNFLVAEEATKVRANRGHIGPWERFTVEGPKGREAGGHCYGDRVNLYSASFNGFLCADKNDEVNAYRTKAGEWEQWTLVDPANSDSRGAVPPDGKVALRSWFGTHLSTPNNVDDLVKHVGSLGVAETWRWVREGRGTYGAFTLKHLGFTLVEGAGFSDDKEISLMGAMNFGPLNLTASGTFSHRNLHLSGEASFTVPVLNIAAGVKLDIDNGSPGIELKVGDIMATSRIALYEGQLSLLANWGIFYLILNPVRAELHAKKPDGWPGESGTHGGSIGSAADEALPPLSETMPILTAVRRIVMPASAEETGSADFLERAMPALAWYRLAAEVPAGEEGRRMTVTLHRTGEPDDFFMDIRAAVVRELAANSRVTAGSPNELIAQASFDRARAVFTADASGVTLTLEYDRSGRTVHRTVEFDFDDAPTAIGLLAESIVSSLMEGNPTP